MAKINEQHKKKFQAAYLKCSRTQFWGPLLNRKYNWISRKVHVATTLLVYRATGWATSVLLSPISRYGRLWYKAQPVLWEKLLYINWVGHLLLKVHPPNYLKQESTGIAQEEVPRKELNQQMKAGRH